MSINIDRRLKDGKPIRTKTMTYENNVAKYTMKETTELSDASYTCRASNAAGSVESNCKVTVQGEKSLLDSSSNYKLLLHLFFFFRRCPHYRDRRKRSLPNMPDQEPVESRGEIQRLSDANHNVGQERRNYRRRKMQNLRRFGIDDHCNLQCREVKLWNVHCHRNRCCWLSRGKSTTQSHRSVLEIILRKIIGLLFNIDLI